VDAIGGRRLSSGSTHFVTNLEISSLFVPLVLSQFLVLFEIFERCADPLTMIACTSRPTLHAHYSRNSKRSVRHIAGSDDRYDFASLFHAWAAVPESSHACGPTLFLLNMKALSPPE
jgi:hypothetical protein